MESQQLSGIGAKICQAQAQKGPGSTPGQKHPSIRKKDDHS